MKTRRVRNTIIAVLGAGAVFAAVEATSSDFIGIFADEGADMHQAITEITLQNGEVITIVYSQGGFQYLPQGEEITAPEAATLITLTNPQMAEFFIPGLFGYTAAGGPAVDLNQKIADATQSDGGLRDNRKDEMDRVVGKTLAVREASSLPISQDFLPANARTYHVNAYSR